eukprot:1160732-Pelagomonas_calceolata.AAC.4
MEKTQENPSDGPQQMFERPSHLKCPVWPALTQSVLAVETPRTAISGPLVIVQTSPSMDDLLTKNTLQVAHISPGSGA